MLLVGLLCERSKGPMLRLVGFDNDWMQGSLFIQGPQQNVLTLRGLKLTVFPTAKHLAPRHVWLLEADAAQRGLHGIRAVAVSHGNRDLSWNRPRGP